MGRCSRRELLRVGLGAAAATAGCSRLDSLTGDDETGTYLDWLPAPEPLDEAPYAVQRFGLAGYREHRDELHPATRRLARRLQPDEQLLLRDLLGRTRSVVFTGLGPRVYLGLLAEDPVGSVRDAGLERVGTYRGLVLFEPGWDDERSATVALGEDVAVVTGRGSSLRGLEAVVDAGRGATPRYHERAERVRAVGTTVGERTFTRLNPTREGHEMGGVVAAARGWDLGADRARFAATFRFEDVPDAEVADVKRTVHERWLEESRTVSVERSGPTVRAQADVAVDRFDFGHAGAPGEDGIPNASFTVERRGAAVVAVHDGVQPVPAPELVVAVDDEPASTPDPEPTDRQFADRYETVTEGDSLAFEVDGPALVTVSWHHPERDDALRLGWTYLDA